MKLKKDNVLFGLGCLGMCLLGGLLVFIYSLFTIFLPLFLASYFGWNYVVTLVIWWLILYVFKRNGGNN